MLQRWTDSGSPPINPPGSSRDELPQGAARLIALRERVRADLHALRHPETPWMPQRSAADGKPLLDVLIVGAGQGRLRRRGVVERFCAHTGYPFTETLSRAGHGRAQLDL
jgi:hypothetical protein